MSRPLSPIERMVDAATGNVPGKPPLRLDHKAIGEAMLAVCDAAEAWHRNPAKRAGQKRLGLAVTAYRKLIP